MNTIDKIIAAGLVALVGYMTYDYNDKRQYCTETTATQYLDMTGEHPKQLSHQKVRAGRCE